MRVAEMIGPQWTKPVAEALAVPHVSRRIVDAHFVLVVAAGTDPGPTIKVLKRVKRPFFLNLGSGSSTGQVLMVLQAIRYYFPGREKVVLGVAGDDATELLKLVVEATNGRPKDEAARSTGQGTRDRPEAPQGRRGAPRPKAR